MNIHERAVRSADLSQQRLRPVAFTVGVVEKFGDGYPSSSPR